MAYGHIYEIVNLKNGKRLVGQTIQKPSYRWANHRRTARKNQHNNVHFQRAWNRDGEQSFRFHVICDVDNSTGLDAAEIKFIEKARRSPKGCYNIRDGGSNGKQSEETKLKIGNANRGKVRSPALRKLWSDLKKGEKNPWYGTHGHPNSVAALRQSNLGATRSIGTRRKIRRSLLRYFRGNK